VFRNPKSDLLCCALDLLDAYYNDQVNGSASTATEKSAAIELFTENIMRGGIFFLDNRNETPYSTWKPRQFSGTGFFVETRERGGG